MNIADPLSFPTPSTSSETLRQTGAVLDRITADELERLFEAAEDKLVLLDCRPPGSQPVIGSAHQVRLPTVLQRRLNNGSLAPASICPQLTAADACRVVIIPDSDSSSSLATRICEILQSRQFRVSLLSEDVTRFCQKYPQFSEPQTTDQELSSLSFGTLPPPRRAFSPPAIAENVEHRGRRPAVTFPAHIMPHLYLGNDETAKNKDVLNGCGIRYIINVTTDLPNYFADDSRLHYLRIPVDDCSSHNLSQYFGDAIAFIEKARTERSAVLVHCYAGISRSVTVCLAYIMYSTHSTLEEAFDLLLKQNAQIQPNFHFMESLTCWERRLFDGVGSTSSSSAPSAASSTASSACSSA